jgi:arginyl-tRNA synthetase
MTAVNADMSEDFLLDLSRLLSRAAGSRLESWDAADLAADVSLERPASARHGDFSSNLAMVAAGRAGRPPRELAVELAADLSDDPRISGLCRRIEVAGPGFVNFFLEDSVLAGAAGSALAAGDDYGRSTPVSGESCLLEFVSANPTGPLHVGHGRYAAYGDSLRRILGFAGYEVSTEFYINDYGAQMELFGRSLAARYGQELGLRTPLPEDGYKGDYVTGLARRILQEEGPRFREELLPEPAQEAISFFRGRGCELVLEDIRAQLERFRISFDSWFSEASLYGKDGLDETMALLRRSGALEERDGALWLATTRFGDDKDRVLIRNNGEPTYFASDIAYHLDKLSRGYDRLIDIWGADHHGYVARVKAALKATSHDPGRLEVVIGQLVNILEMGEKKQMSKRAGRMVTLSELIDSIGVDAARFFLVDRSHDSTLDLDLEKARLRSEENPVFYVQYAHARICSIMRKAEEEGLSPGVPPTDIELEPHERELVLKLLGFPAVVRGAARSRGPHRVTAYARELAAAFHVFYHNCPVIRAEGALASFRLSLCRLTANVVRTSLDLVGVEAPESM